MCPHVFRMIDTSTEHLSVIVPPHPAEPVADEQARSQRQKEIDHLMNPIQIVGHVQIRVSATAARRILTSPSFQVHPAKGRHRRTVPDFQK